MVGLLKKVRVRANSSPFLPLNSTIQSLRKILLIVFHWSTSRVSSPFLAEACN
uniref:Eukaryotic translation initiation factor 3 subunit n=1 Tax=Solanum tuberosum TaxID=4113 RepID=M1B247_SOLTU